MNKNTEEEIKYDSMNMPIYPVKIHMNEIEKNRASLYVSIEIFEKLAAEYKVAHYTTLIDDVNDEPDEPLLWKHFAYLPDGCYVYSEVYDLDSTLTQK